MDAAYEEELKRLSTLLDECKASAQMYRRLIIEHQGVDWDYAWYHDQLQATEHKILQSQTNISLLKHQHNKIPLIDDGQKASSYEEIIKKTNLTIYKTSLDMKGLHKTLLKRTNGRDWIKNTERVSARIMECNIVITRLRKFKLENDREAFFLTVAMAHHKRLGARSPLNDLPEGLLIEIIESVFQPRIAPVKKEDAVKAQTTRSFLGRMYNTLCMFIADYLGRVYETIYVFIMGLFFYCIMSYKGEKLTQISLFRDRYVK